jgi:serine/threonine protein kinase/tetratricopeptide (TPR) repeat protein
VNENSLWDRTQEIFLKAIDIPPALRAAFVERACAGDRRVLEEVQSLLAHDIPEAELAGVFQYAAAALIEDGSLIGQRVGAYRIQRELGHGGMGAVYLAVRADDEFSREVAIKVVKRGMDTHAMLERFRYERQILAGLDHPYIARLLDGGSTADHQPYFVMEYVQGRPIDRFCVDEKLGPHDICRLFLKVCEAVAYAHRNLVVHRDLKPGNIIVTAEGSPKLLDFGVAKLLSPDERDPAITGLFHRPLTPEYASPEQVRGQAVTTAADVYSLGAVLYELLTGARIHASASSTASEWERLVCEAEVPRPSSRKRQLSGDIDNILLMALRKEPERRYSSVEQFAGDIRRHLGGLPVLARQDSFRYRAGKYLGRHRVSIAAAALVAASLVGGSVLALSEARVARAERAVAEHERTVAEDRSRQADSAHALAEQQRVIAEREAGNARSEQQRAEQRLNEMVLLANKSLFDVHMAIERLPGATPARQKLVQSTLEFLQTLEKETGDDPRLRVALAAAYLRVGEVQGAPNTPSLGETANAEKSLARGADWLRPLVGVKPPDPNVLAVWIDINRARAELMQTTGHDDDAAKTLRALLPIAATLSRLSPGDAREATTHEVLIPVLQPQHPAEAVEHARLAVEGFTRIVAAHPEDADTALALSSSQSSWASVLRPVDPAEALKHYRESARIREDLVARFPNHSAARRGLMLVYGQIASVLGDAFMVSSAHDVEGARQYYTKAAVIAHELLRADPVNRLAQYDVASVELRLGALDPKPGQEAESVAALMRGRDLFEDLAKADPISVRYLSPLALSHEFLGKRLRDAGKPDDALVEFRKSLEITDKALARNPNDTPSANGSIAVNQAIATMQAARGDRAMALENATRAIETAERMRRNVGTPATQLRVAAAWDCLAQVHKLLSDWADARAAAVHAADEWRKASGDRNAELRQAERLIAECDTHLRL